MQFNIEDRLTIIALETKLKAAQKYAKRIRKDLKKIENNDNETSFEHKLENIKTELELIENLTN